MNSWHYEPAVDLDRSLTDRLRDFPRQPDMLVYATRSLAAIAVRGWMRTYHRFAIHRRERLPLGQSFVIVANHCSHLDIVCLLRALPIKYLHRAVPAAAKDYFFESLPRTAVASVFANALPF